MVIIYSPQNSTRFSYTVSLLFSLLPGAEYMITHDKDEFLAHKGARLNYSAETIEGAINITPHGLLWEETIRPIEPQIGQWQGLPTLFPGGGDIPFDIFSAAFFLVSRYEEYTDTRRDHHKRYTAQQSFAFKNGFLDLPLVNIWADELRKALNEKHGLSLQKLPYRFISTIDIDQVFYYKYKPPIINYFGGLKQWIRGEWQEKKIRDEAWYGLSPDPNDTFDWMGRFHDTYKTETIYFFHIGLKKGPYDPKPLHHKKEVRKIIKGVAEKNNIGIHPSYLSFNNKDSILAERMKLEEITGKGVSLSRQHFLRFSLPATYRVLMECGITHEYSMGYADVCGYRAGISAPFQWFDLEKNEATSLTVHPFAVMDVTLKNYMKVQANEAVEIIHALVNPVKKHGGTFMTLWHNESVGTHSQWRGWRDVYIEQLKECAFDDFD